MIVSDDGFISLTFITDGEVQLPVSLELTKVGTNEVTEEEINEFFILRNDGILNLSFFRTTQLGSYDYRIMGNGSSYGSGRITFETKVNKPTYGGEKAIRGEKG
jgi:hypothetical protein